MELAARRHALSDFLSLQTEFAGLPEDMVDALVRSLRPMPVPAGTTVVREGDPPGPLYVVTEGRMRVSRGGRQVTFLGPGEHFGERSLFTGEPRSATVRAIDDADLLVVEPEVFRSLLDGHSPFRERIARRVEEYDLGGSPSQAWEQVALAGSGSGATAEGLTAQTAAESVVQAAGFSVQAHNTVDEATGATIDLIATDATGRRWHFDVTGSFTSTRPGLSRTAAVWKTLGRASTLSAVGIGPIVLLTTNLPERGSVGDGALRSVAGLTFFDAIEMLGVHGKAVSGSTPVDSTA